MGTDDARAFRPRFGCEPPPGLLELLGHRAIRDALPAAFRIAGANFIVEIQHFLDIDDPSSFRPGRGLLAFAVTADGCDLLVEAHDPQGRIFQEECGEVDGLGISLRDLLHAEHSSMK